MTWAWPTGRTTTEFDDFILHVDGWLCEVQDAQIRHGLHVLGAGAARARRRVGLVLAMLRPRSVVRHTG